MDDLTPSYTLKEAMALLVNVNRNRPHLAINVKSGPGQGKTSLVSMAARVLSRVCEEPTLLVFNTMPGHTDETFGGYQWIEQRGDGVALSRFTRPSTFPLLDELQKGGFTYKTFVDGKQADDVAVPFPEELPSRWIVLLDDIGQASVDVKKLGASLKLDRQINGYVLPANATVVATTNRAADRSGVTRALAYDTNRSFDLELCVSTEEWLEYARKVRVLPPLTAYVAHRSGACFVDEVPVDPAQPFCTPRSMVLASQMLEAQPACWDGERLSHGKATYRTLRGWLGDDVAAEILIYARIASEWPSMSEVIDDPDGAACPGPESVESAFVVSQMVVDFCLHMSPERVLQHAHAITAYIGRLPAEVASSTFDTILQDRRGLRKTFSATPAYAQWLQDNKETVEALAGA